MDWLLIQVAASTFPFLQIPSWATRLVIGLVVLAFPIALVLAWAFELTPTGIQRTHDLAPDAPAIRSSVEKYMTIIAIAVLAAGGLLTFQIMHSKTRADANEKSIAVLPFAATLFAASVTIFLNASIEAFTTAFGPVILTKTLPVALSRIAPHSA